GRHDLGDDGLVVTDDAGEQVLARAQLADEIPAHLLLHGHGLVARGLEITKGAGACLLWHAGPRKREWAGCRNTPPRWQAGTRPPARAAYRPGSGPLDVLARLGADPDLVAGLHEGGHLELVAGLDGGFLGDGVGRVALHDAA